MVVYNSLNTKVLSKLLVSLVNFQPQIITAKYDFHPLFPHTFPRYLVYVAESRTHQEAGRARELEVKPTLTPWLAYL